MLLHYVWLQSPLQSLITLSVGFWDGDQMRIFARGFVAAMIVALFFIVLFKDVPAELSDLMLYTAFICGALSQVIKQCKGES